MTQNQQAFITYLNEHPTLVPGILKACHVSSSFLSYEDYRQEASLLLWDLFQTHDLSTFEKKAFTLVKSRLIDRLRREHWFYTHHQFEKEDQHEKKTEDTVYTIEENIIVYHFLDHLTKEEKRLCLSLMQGYSLSQFAKQNGCSRNVFYRQLKQIKEKAKLFF